jgi:hypothetical protein
VQQGSFQPVSFQHLRLPGSFAQAGYAYGKACAELLVPARIEAYLASLAPVTRTHRDDMPRFASRWASTLPEHYQEQIEALADGARTSPTIVQQWLYADIAAPSRPSSPAAQGTAGLIASSGPLCSGIISHDDTGSAWVARNCDWHEATLSRGTAAVFHAVPGRIPSLAVGLMGDIDCDTGMNAEGLWLHMHTLLAHDEPRAGVSCISWLFWMREALETCATIAELEQFIARTDRDRGVLLFAAEGKTGERAIFECGRASAQRIRPWALSTQLGTREVLFATNHCQHKHPQQGEGCDVAQASRVSPSNGTVSRYNRLHQLLRIAHPEHGPDDLAEILSDERVEMRVASTGSSLRTIYSSVAHPRSRTVWFASGAVPAASTGTWRRISWDAD